MNFIKRHPLMFFFLLVFLGIIIGTFSGWIYAGYKVQIIAEQIKQSHPNDPIDGLWIVTLGIIFKGLVIGTIIGIVSGITVFFFGKSKSKQSAFQ